LIAERHVFTRALTVFTSNPGLVPLKIYVINTGVSFTLSDQKAVCLSVRMSNSSRVAPTHENFHVLQLLLSLLFKHHVFLFIGIP
jgi:hypothetical protein